MRGLELAFDSRGRWRAETALTGAAGDTRLALRVRGGLGAFRPLAEPARAGPPQAVAASALHAFGPVHAAADPEDAFAFAVHLAAEALRVGRPGQPDHERRRQHVLHVTLKPHQSALLIHSPGPSGSGIREIGHSRY